MNSNLQIASTDKEVIIENRNKEANLHEFFIVFGVISILIALFQLFNNETKLFAKIFISVWLCGWFTLMFPLTRVFLLKKFGKENIQLSEDRLTVEYFYFNKMQIIVDCQIINIQSLAVHGSFNNRGKDLFYEGKGKVVVQVLNKEFFFGKFIKENEAKYIVSLIQSARDKNFNPNLSLISDELKESKKDVPLQFKNETLRKLYKWRFYIVAPIAFLFFLQDFLNNNSNYNDLKVKGIVTKVTASFITNFLGDSYYYYFITNNGVKIERSGKCHDEEGFNKQYKNLKIIYNPDNPNVFLEYQDFLDYNIFSKIFLLLFCTVFLTVWVGIVIRGISSYSSSERKGLLD